jgi:hypothetical protein
LRPAADCERVEQRRNGAAACRSLRRPPQEGAVCQRISTYCERRRPLYLLIEPADACSQYVLLKGRNRTVERYTGLRGGWHGRLTLSLGRNGPRGPEGTNAPRGFAHLATAGLLVRKSHADVKVRFRTKDFEAEYFHYTSGTQSCAGRMLKPIGQSYVSDPVISRSQGYVIGDRAGVGPRHRARW